jgi:hypothetical protein
MTELRPGQLMDSNVRVVTLDQAIRDARAALDEYECRYGVVSDRLGEAFTDAAGRLHKTGAYLQWQTMLERWRQLTTAPPPV